METYMEMRERHIDEINTFSFKNAVDDADFKKMMNSWGFKPDDTSKIAWVGGCSYIKQSDFDAYLTIFNRHCSELKSAIYRSVEDNSSFVFDMFYYQLCVFEYIITGDYTEALQFVGLSELEVKANSFLNEQLKLAIDKIFE